jgi:GTPase SAR1 family protein
VLTWIKFIRDIESTMIVIVGNKIDLNEDRKVDFSEGEKLANQENCMFFEVSAKTDTNIQKMLFHSIAELPFFDAFKSDRRSDLVGELEMENNDTKLNMSGLDSVRNEIQIKNAIEKSNKATPMKKKNCSC